MMGCGNDLLQQVYETGFAVDDVGLYLDTHPDDQEAMQYFRYVRQKNEEAKAAYEAVFGPLMIDDVKGDIWNWVDDPWPWEGGRR